MGFLRGLGMCFISFLIILSLILLGIQISTSKLLKLDYYDSILNESNSYELLSSRINNSSSFLLITIPSNENESGANSIRRLILHLLGNTLDYLKGDSEVLDLNVDVNIDLINSFFINKIDSLPYCQTNSKENFNFSSNSTCRPIQNSSEELLNSLLSNNNISSILDQRKYNLAETFDKDGNLAKIKSYVNYYILMRYLLIALLVLLIILAALFSLHKEGSAFRWVGFSIVFSSGILLYLHNFISSKISQITLGNFLGGFLSNYPNISDAIFSPLLRNLYIYSIIILIFGVVLIIISFFIKNKKQIKEN